MSIAFYAIEKRERDNLGGLSLHKQRLNAMILKQFLFSSYPILFSLGIIERTKTAFAGPADTSVQK